MEATNQTKAERYALVTVSTPAFLPGTAVMLRSFLDHNPWFSGDVILLTDEVVPELRDSLTAIYPVQFRLIGEAILRNGERVRRAVTDRAILPVRFFAMELFAIEGYDRLLYLDSDVLVRADCRPLFERRELLVAAGDGFHYRDKVRTGPDYRPHKLRWWQSRKNYWGGLFNAGIVSLDGAFPGPANYRALADMIDPKYFSHGVRRFHNQKLLNIYFKGKATLMPADWNYRLGMADHILEKDGVRFEDAKIIHYTAKRKPWMPEQAEGRLAAGGDYQTAFQLWHRCWQSLAPSLRTQIEQRTTAYNPTAAKPPRP